MTDPSASVHAHDPEKQRRLIAAAARAFARIGFTETNVDVIAHDAGVAKGTVYLYFENKRALFHAVLDELQRRLADGASPVRRGDAPGERLRAFIRRQLLLADEEPELFRCYTSALFGVNRDFQAAAMRVFSWQVDQLRAHLAADGRSRGRTRAQVLAANILSAALLRGITERAGAGTRVEEELLLASVAGTESTR